MSKAEAGTQRQPSARAARVAPGGEPSGYRVVDEQGEPLSEANAFLSALGARGLSVETIRAYAFDLAVLYRWLHEADLQLEQLQHAELLDFIREQRRAGAAPRTINRRLTSCRMLYQFCFERPLPVGRGASLPAPHYRGSGKDRRLGLHQLRRRRRVKLRVQVPGARAERRWRRRRVSNRRGPPTGSA